ncbi:endonuclease/exonuclease/phosphatase family protein [Micromonospora sp. CPCC 206060]|uniref:endonuclease/exonuclease/phosphatase family protein n=1 Tax=Micromonospora sp. CPCC 206060 TaxID=3122406 RepID=UPI002FEF99CA
MTWNIRNGGQDRTAGGRAVRPGDDPARLAGVVEVVDGYRPDILAVQELRGFRRDDRMARFAAAVGMRPYLAREWFGQPVAVLVRPPGRVVGAGPLRRPFHHAAQQVVVPTSAGPLRVLAAHLHPYSGTRRLVEARWLAAACRGGPDRQVLLMGDLNTLDPWTDHAGRLDRLPAAYRGRHLRRDSTVDTRAVALLDRAGLVDLYRHAGQGDPETAPTRHGGGAEFSGMRLDYLFGSPALAARTRVCQVLRGGAAEWASDHYPVVAELDLDLY